MPSYASACERIRAYANACYNDNDNDNDNDIDNDNDNDIDNEYDNVNVNEYDNERIFHMWKIQRLNNFPHMLTKEMFDSRIKVEGKHILR